MHCPILFFSWSFILHIAVLFIKGIETSYDGIMPKKFDEINMQCDPQQFQEKPTKIDTENWLPVKTDSHACIQYLTDHTEDNTQSCT